MYVSASFATGSRRKSDSLTPPMEVKLSHCLKTRIDGRLGNRSTTLPDSQSAVSTTPIRAAIQPKHFVQFAVIKRPNRYCPEAERCCLQVDILHGTANFHVNVAVASIGVLLSGAIESADMISTTVRH